MSYQPQRSPSLVMRRGPEPNQAFPLHKTVLTLGRAADNDIAIDDGEVSRHHARLTLQGSNWVLEDLGSRNGTFVNGQRITGPVILTPGCQVALGPDVLFSMEGGTPAPAWAPPVHPSTVAPSARRGRFQWPLLAGLAALVILALAGAAILAYFYLNPPAPETLTIAELSLVFGPDIAFQEPAPGTQVGLGASVLVFATAYDENRVTQVDLWVDDQLVTQQFSPDPNGVTPLSLIHNWVADTPGTHALLVRAYNSLGAMGESPVLYVTVLEEPEPAPVTAQYVAQPGDTPATVAMVVNVSAAAIQGANPTISGVITSGQVIVVPVPPQPPASPQQGPVPGGPKPGGPVPGGAGQPGQAAAPPPGPSNAPLKAPSLLKADVKDCSVTLVWQDNSEDEVGFLVFRQVFGAPGLLLLKTENARNGTGSQIQYVDQVPGPDTYLYYIEAAKAGGRAASNPLKVVVPPTAACTQAPGFKQVIFQPRNVEASSRYNSLALFFDVGSGIYRRVPSGQGPGLPPGDWRGQRQVMPAPASVYLDPGAPVVLSVTGEGWGGRASEALGTFSQSHPQSELSPTKEWSGQGAGFNMKYSLWLENVTWGKGTTNKIPAPTNLRFAKDANELSKIAGCAGGKCDLKTALVWDWPGDQKMIEGYILYRFYDCPGKDAQIMAPEVVVGSGNQGKVTRPAPSGCAARYQVSAFGRAGESEPSKALEVPANAPAASVAVAFEELTIKGGLVGSAGHIYLQANQIILRSANVALQDRILLGRIVLDEKMPNNQLAVNLGKGESLQLGFRAQAGSDYCAGQEILSLQPGEDWTKYYDKPLVLKSKDNLCELTVKISQSAAGPPAAGQPAKPKTDIAVVDIYLSDQDVYAVLSSQGDALQNHEKMILGTCWLDPDDETLCWSWEEIETSWPASASVLTTKVGNAKNAKRGWGREKFSVKVEPLFDFDDLNQSNNRLEKELELPRGGYGYTCSRNEECRSEYCADASPEHKGKCALKDGTGQEGEYCHHGNHCASGVCQCPGWGYEPGERGLCKYWEKFTSNFHGTCTYVKNGEACSENRNCESGYCANGKKCAPIDGTGQPGDYCHHDNQCASGLCLCPNGWIGGKGFCQGWENFTSTQHGTCTAALEQENGATCSRHEDCQSGYCADGKKCAPKDGTGKPGEYCHHDNQCASGLCLCPDGWIGGKGFCRGWESFTPARHGRCTAQDTNGASCSKNEDCESGYCADGKKCAPKDGTGKPGEYCHHDNQCETGFCLCPDGYDGKFCRGWQDFTPTKHGRCRTPAKNGETCSQNNECESGYCAPRRDGGGRCAPPDGTGKVGDRCHHDNHCQSGMCGNCFKSGPWCVGDPGICWALYKDGTRCSENRNCESGYCADGKRCAPKDGTGKKGDYCHHNNHCASGKCLCPDGLDWLGFCNNWQQDGKGGKCQ